MRAPCPRTVRAQTATDGREAARCACPPSSRRRAMSGQASAATEWCADGSPRHRGSPHPHSHTATGGRAVEVRLSACSRKAPHGDASAQTPSPAACGACATAAASARHVQSALRSLSQAPARALAQSERRGHHTARASRTMKPGLCGTFSTLASLIAALDRNSSASPYSANHLSSSVRSSMSNSVRSSESSMRSRQRAAEGAHRASTSVAALPPSIGSLARASRWSHTYCRDSCVSAP